MRYIAVTDGVDSLTRQEMDITPFKNILNDMYSRDISKKVLAGRMTRSRQGKFCGGPVSYTHLDVYKRQPLDGGAGCTRRFCKNTGPVSTMPVSDTHLDVYKRQDYITLAQEIEKSDDTA